MVSTQPGKAALVPIQIKSPGSSSNNTEVEDVPRGSPPGDHDDPCVQITFDSFIPTCCHRLLRLIGVYFLNG